MREIKILLTDKTHPILKELLLNEGFCCDEIISQNSAEILSIIDQYHAVVVRSKIIVDKNFVDKGTRLQCIGRVGSGMETIDVAYAEQKGIACLNSPEGNRDAVAEHALGMLLCLLNNLNWADSEVRNNLWQREANRGVELKEQTVGIIGFGNMGAAFAQRLQGFGANILAYDKYKTNYAPHYVCETSLEEVLQKSNIISLHLPLTAETKYLVDSTFIQSLKNDIILINTARGEIVKTPHLVQGLQSGKIKGACLDVLEYEDLANDGIFSNPNKEAQETMTYLQQSKKVVLTPHIAGWTQQSKKKLAEVLAHKIIACFKG